MKIKFVALILIVLLCLTSCENHNTVVNCASSPLLLSAEIQESRVEYPNSFAIQVGVGNPTYFLPHATMTVWTSSPNLVIIAPDGSASTNSYTYEYEDFGNEKFKPYLNSDAQYICRYIETYVFYFNEKPEKQTGVITFSCRAEIDETQASPGYSGSAGNSVVVYYKVRNGKIRVSTRYKDYRNWTYFDQWKEAFS